MKNFILILLTIFIITSCNSKSENLKQNSIEWRAHTLNNNVLVFVENIDTLGVEPGDTVYCVAYDDEPYAITNTHYQHTDTIDYIPVYFKNDTTLMKVDRVTVVLDKKVIQ